jgi:hypothetical protein
VNPWDCLTSTLFRSRDLYASKYSVRQKVNNRNGWSKYSANQFSFQSSKLLSEVPRLDRVLIAENATK